ncbi:MAG: glycosyltransferase [Tildeniella nuda ZEHNDER 1965/U140]|jgi:exonuclease VII small subunit|nr:glycosyltransferase [Tildeniella nuda ZEHNDER 1965/U140]
MELEEPQPQRQIMSKDMGRSTDQSQLSQTNLEQLQAQLDQRQTQLETIVAQLDQTQLELEVSRAQLAASEAAMAALRQHIDWMETSKFWKVRGKWLKLSALSVASLKLSVAPFKALLPALSTATVRATLLAQRQQWYWLSGILLRGTHSLLEPEQATKIAAAQSGRFSSSHCFAEPPDYADWIAAYEPDARALKRQRADALLFSEQPVFSVVLPVYKVPLLILQETLESVFRQTYSRWELCIAFADASAPETEQYLRSLAQQNDHIKLSVMPVNLGISGNSNEAAKLASGDFVVLLDHDDALADFAFYEIVKTLNQQPDLDFIYSDKDCISENGAVRSRLLLKPQWSPEILYSANYLTHLCVIRRTLLNAIGGFRSETDGAQDWDLFFRVVEQTSRIARTEGILYHWRIIQGSTSLGIESKPYALDAQLQTVQSHLKRSGLQAMATPHAECGFQIHWTIPAATATILVDGDVAWEMLVQCLSSLSSTLDPTLHKVCVVLSDADDRTHQHEKTILAQSFSAPLTWAYSTASTSKLNVFAETAKHNPADVITVVSGQIARFQKGWLQELSGWAMGHPAIGFVSALVIAETGYVVEAGLVVDCHGNGSPLMRGNPLYSWGAFGGSLWYRNCSASSPWAVTFLYDDYVKIGELPTDESSLQRSIIKLCQTVCLNGKRGLVNPHARVFLSALPSDDIPAHASLGDDPYFHPAFSSVVPLKLNVKDGEKRWES